MSRLPRSLDSCDEVWDSFWLVEAVHLCKAFIIISPNDVDKVITVSIHLLVHAWVYVQQDTDK